MNKNVIMGVIVLVVVGLAIYFLMGSPNQEAVQQETGTQQDSVQDQATSPVDEAAAAPNSLKDLFAMGSRKCTYSTTDAASGATTQGTVYAGNNRMRMDASVTTGGQTQMMHSIMMDNMYYTWMDGQENYAVKMKFDPTTGADSGAAGSDGQAQVDWDKQVDYNCDSWSPDQAQFTLPAGVTFMDLGDLSQYQNMMPGGNQ